MTNATELTTEEIVRALRFCNESDEIECHECPCRVAGGTNLCHMDKLADRLESQSKQIAELTARAESAERERDAFIDKIKGRCAECKHEHLYSYVEPCESCHNANGHPNWQWRGLPQDGEGK